MITTGGYCFLPGYPVIVLFPASQLRADRERHYIKQKVITYAAVPHMGCNEMWVCPAFWPHFTEKVKQYIEQNTTKAPPSAAPQGGRRFAPAPLGVCCIFSMYCLTFSVKCCQNAGHTHISLHPMWGTPAHVITFCLM